MTCEDGVFRSVTVSDLELLVQEIVGKLNTVTVWLFRGEMGSGKTTLIKTVCKVLGVEESMSSPAFSIVNEYQTVDDAMDMKRQNPLTFLYPTKLLGADRYH